MLFVDQFDHDGTDGHKLRGKSLDISVLSTAKRVSIFWVTETLARAKRIKRWVDDGILVTDNSIQYPWIKIISFDKDKAEV